MIPLFKVFMANEAADAVNATLFSGFIGEGPRVVEFEAGLQKKLGRERLLTVNSGTSALHLAVHLAANPEKRLQIDTDVEIISTPMTCTATNTPIVTNGCKIVWADVDPVSGNIDPESVAKKITKKTRAVMAVHWGGNPCAMDKLRAVAQQAGIKVIEDAAHAFGSTYNGKPVGADSDYVAFSFQAIKHLTAGDGGCLTLASEEDDQRGKLLRWFGIDRTAREGLDLRCELDVAEAGYKFHMNDINASIGLANLAHIDEIVGAHRRNAALYNELFADADNVVVVPETPGATSAYWLYTLHVANRDGVLQGLKDDGVMSSKVHSRNDTHTMFKDARATLPGVQAFHDTHLCIPVGWWVTPEQVAFIAERVKYYAKADASLDKKRVSCAAA
jgi:dTDP-4-amino-4,6-dideoxygalactose transaminase